LEDVHPFHTVCITLEFGVCHILIKWWLC